MANGQTLVPPAESGEVGLPEILLNPGEVPEARAFYSSNPDFLDGASDRPDPIEDIEMAIAIDEAGQTENVDHAMRLIAVHAGDEKEPGGFVIVDHSLALKGLKWLRRNFDDKDMRKAVIDTNAWLRGNIGENRNGNGHRQENGTAKTDEDQAPDAQNGHGNGNGTKLSKKEVQRQQSIEKQRRHQAERQAEIDSLSEWQEREDVLPATYLVDSLEHIDTVEKPSGDILIIEKDSFKPFISERVRALAADPNELFAEANDIDTLNNFLDYHKAPILRGILRYAQKELDHKWREYHYSTPQEFSDAFARWLEVFSGFSDEYKSSVIFTNNDAYTDSGLNDPVALREKQINEVGADLLQASLANLAISHYEEFLDLVYGMAQDAMEADDEFTRNNVFNIIAGAITESTTAHTLVLNVLMAEGAEEEDKLKSVDLTRALEEAGCTTSPKGRRNYDEVPPKVYKRYYRARMWAEHLGIDVEDPKRADKVYNRLAKPLFESIKSGELPGSLYLKVKELQQ